MHFLELTSFVVVVVVVDDCALVWGFGLGTRIVYQLFSLVNILF